MNKEEAIVEIFGPLEIRNANWPEEEWAISLLLEKLNRISKGELIQLEEELESLKRTWERLEKHYFDKCQISTQWRAAHELSKRLQRNYSHDTPAQLVAAEFTGTHPSEWFGKWPVPSDGPDFETVPLSNWIPDSVSISEATEILRKRRNAAFWSANKADKQRLTLRVKKSVLELALRLSHLGDTLDGCDPPNSPASSPIAFRQRHNQNKRWVVNRYAEIRSRFNSDFKARKQVAEDYSSQFYKKFAWDYPDEDPGEIGLISDKTIRNYLDN